MNEYMINLKKKGWNVRSLAGVWGMTTRNIYYIASNPSKRDLHALDGLPDLTSPKQLTPVFIYLQLDGEGGDEYSGHSATTWAEKRIFNSDVRYKRT